ARRPIYLGLDLNSVASGQRGRALKAQRVGVAGVLVQRDAPPGAADVLRANVVSAVVRAGRADSREQIEVAARGRQVDKIELDLLIQRVERGWEKVRPLPAGRRGHYAARCSECRYTALRSPVIGRR